MRYVKFLILTLAFVLSMAFFVQNTAPLSGDIQLMLNLIFVKLYSQPLPVSVLILFGFLVGALFCLFYFLMDRIRLGRELKGLRKRAAALEEELLALRTKALTPPVDQTPQAPVPTEGPADGSTLGL